MERQEWLQTVGTGLAHLSLIQVIAQHVLNYVSGLALALIVCPDINLAQKT
jgi:hypothetical protein